MGIQAKRVSGVVKFSRETMLTCEAEAGRARKSERLKMEIKNTHHRVEIWAGGALLFWHWGKTISRRLTL
jgi:hypothetical protein